MDSNSQLKKNKNNTHTHTHTWKPLPSSARMAKSGKDLCWMVAALQVGWGGGEASRPELLPNIHGGPWLAGGGGGAH